MARIQLELPERFVFETQLTVQVSHLNYGGHVGNDTILTFFQDARVQFYNSIGVKDELHFDGSVGQIIADAAIQYTSESFAGDVLVVAIGLAGFNKYGFDMFYLITNKVTGKHVARGKTGIVCFDYDKRKVASVPEILLNKLKSL